ncbi:pseudouridine synthase [Rhodoferax mekongensis]|uniref:Pseudouridine synthase n=1 Tax=Rhodoferax mekongensis TaxID=3068341 RepID=A0ABZ0AXR7_9BURK|nr:pseudouridine synthase [Rhodoferax sp. TBRC 17307]WNO04100.1 pseudouridine synthase [Rhodoferax sp. TBRC 17307]
MARIRPLAPAARHGVRPSCVVVTPGPWKDLLDFFCQRFPSVPASTWQKRFASEDIIDADNQAARPTDAATAGRRLYYFRAVPDEPSIPFQEEVIWQDEHLLVVDKPHFLPVVPSGKHVRETLLARLQLRLNLPDLSPVHRIDKDTAGLVLFSVQPVGRNAYQALFRERRVSKSYECIAPWKPGLVWPLHRESRIGDAEHFMQQTEVPGEVNAITDIEPLEVAGDWARYALRPLTGQRHQLRVHMHALGLPILFDGIYPELTPEGTNVYSRPLQLLAKRLAFTDPLTGVARVFESRRSLLPLQTVQHISG